MPRMTDAIAEFHWAGRSPEDIDAYIRTHAGRLGARSDRRLEAALHLRRRAAAPPPARSAIAGLRPISEEQARFYWPDPDPVRLRAYVESHRDGPPPTPADERRLAAALHLLGGLAPRAATPSVAVAPRSVHASAAPLRRAPARALSYALIANPGNARGLAPPLAQIDRILVLAETLDVDTGNASPGEHPAALEAEFAAFGLLRALEWTFEVDPSLDDASIRAFLGGLGLREDPRLTGLAFR